MNRLDNHIRPYFENLSLKEIDAKTILFWKQEINQKDYSLSYKQSIFNILINILDFAKTVYGIDDNIAKIVGNFKNVNQIKKEIQIWNHREFMMFTRALPKDDWKDYIYYAFYNFLYYTGVRLSLIHILMIHGKSY